MEQMQSGQVFQSYSLPVCFSPLALLSKKQAFKTIVCPNVNQHKNHP